ncbi:MULTISPECIES: cobalamin biosynthesis protein [Fischerella]|uniref:cobalamin biosynthesis protein n=1 Tax=Fischerella TaxID=1190 RepID=UPI00037DB06F|nr:MULTISPECIES: cobalamin biosynthesis protein [Fischerella]MBD2432578.1 cobalamin biosynthesis protein [Fischerella sp. FACHB-380]
MLLAEFSLRSKNLWVGVGCQKGTSRELIEVAIAHVFGEHQLSQSAIAGLATIDTKVDEVGLVELCRERKWLLKTFSAEILRTVYVPNPSQLIHKHIATPSVAEAAALCAAECKRLLVPKQIFRPVIKDQKGTVTVAIAQAKDRKV